MYLSIFTDDELLQWAQRISPWMNNGEKDKIDSELERRGFMALDPIDRARRREQAREDERAATEKEQMELVREWREQGCVKDSAGNWAVPHELIWRSLPNGEDL